jgi:hypothetical protein
LIAFGGIKQSGVGAESFRAKKPYVSSLSQKTSASLSEINRGYRGSNGSEVIADGEMWLGYLDQYPDYTTQGNSLDDRKNI